MIDDGDPAGERPDSETFQRLVEPYVSELRVHCYRILGSVPDAEDVLQETLMAAWRGLPRFEQRSSLRVWLYRIATNACLTAIESRKLAQRVLPDRMVAPSMSVRMPDGAPPAMGRPLSWDATLHPPLHRLQFRALTAPEFRAIRLRGRYRRP